MAVGVHPAPEVGQVILRVPPLPVAGEAVLGRRRRIAAPGPLVSDVGPEPRGPRDRPAERWRRPAWAKSIQAEESSAEFRTAIVPPSAAARSAAAPASRSLRAKAYRNIPSAEFDESPVEEVRVLDPRHPLYGRSFRVIRRAAHRGGNFPSSFEVEHCNGSSLLIPIAVTEWHDLPGSRTTLSIDALRELIDVVDCLDDHGDRPERSLDDAAAVSAASDRRRRRRGPGGGPS